MAYQHVIYNMNERYAHAVRMIGKMSTKSNPNVLNKTDFIEGIEQLNPRIAGYIEEAVKGIEEPVFEVYGQCSALYNMAFMNIKGKGGKVAGKGVISFKPNLENADCYSMNFKIDLPGDRRIIGSREYGNYLECKKYAPDGSITEEQLNMDGDVISRFPMDTTIVKCEKVGRWDEYKYLNSEGIPVIETDGFGKLTELLFDGSKIKISSFSSKDDAIKFEWSHPHISNECTVYFEPNNEIRVSIANYRKPFKEDFPIFNMRLNDDLKITQTSLQRKYYFEPMEAGIFTDCKSYSRPCKIPDKILDQMGVREIFERLKVMRQILSESEEPLDNYQLIDKFHKKFYRNRIVKAEKAVPKKSTQSQRPNRHTQPIARNDKSRDRYTKVPINHFFPNLKRKSA